MAQFNSAELSGYPTTAPFVNPSVLPSGVNIGGRVRVHKATITMASQASGDTILIATPKRGDMFLYGILAATATLGASATIAIGTSASTGKYRAAAVFTAVETPTLFGLVAAETALTADEFVIITIGVAALPSSGTFTVKMFFAQT